MSYSIRQLKNLFVQNESVSVVFFVGKGKTHRKVLNFRKIMLYSVGIGAASFLGIFSLMGATLLSNKTTSLSQELLQRRNQIFEYQSQYEQLFEIAYDLVEAPKPVMEQVLIEDSSTQNWQPNITSSSIYFKKIELSSIDRGSSVDFSLVNIGTDLVEGSTWAIGKVIQDDGTAFYASAPSLEMVFPKDGTILDASLANPFKFKNQWNSRLELKLPETIIGELLYVTIYIADNDGKILLRQTLQPISIPKTSIESH